ncbi:MAG TPA: A/G-specific adenine glycosylase, partial [Gammaproteobacteria bacterium]|nr:A/G-specific adenine glycosylase [Gammaproteobacteria bacterium]
AAPLLDWYDRCGRHNLPWQRDRSPYFVWVSEVMLQQTQVATVIPYFERFVARFPTLAALAEAPLDAVLALWSGLGYYARARNLHRAARLAVERHGGELPADIDALTALPGIGRSTAGAVLALSRGARHAILDGNVKRVLARYHAIEGWPGQPAVQRELWARAEEHTPFERVADYTQAIMDLGATLCTRARPACTVCPIAEGCRACRGGIQARLPAPRPRRERPRRSAVVLVVEDEQGRVLLERRPSEGVWGGLFSLPELADSDEAAAWTLRRLGAAPVFEQRLPTIAHAFTHFDLELEPVRLALATPARSLMDSPDWLWYNPSSRSTVGIAAPIRDLLQSLAAQHEERE